jgi:hypothetical protein
MVNVALTATMSVGSGVHADWSLPVALEADLFEAACTTFRQPHDNCRSGPTLS